MWYAKSKIISVISCSIFFQPEIIHFETFDTCILANISLHFIDARSSNRIINTYTYKMHLFVTLYWYHSEAVRKMITIVVKRLPEVSPHIGPGQWTSVQIQQVCRLAKEKWQSSLKNLYNIYFDKHFGLIITTQIK